MYFLIKLLVTGEQINFLVFGTRHY